MSLFSEVHVASYSHQLEGGEREKAVLFTSAYHFPAVGCPDKSLVLMIPEAL